MARVKASVLTALRDQVRLVLLDYKSCKLDYDWEWEFKVNAIAGEIAKRIVDNYMVLAGMKKRPTEAQEEIAKIIESEGVAEHDPWAACRNEEIIGLFMGAVEEIVRRKG